MRFVGWKGLQILLTAFFIVNGCLAQILPDNHGGWLVLQDLSAVDGNLSYHKYRRSYLKNG